MLTETGVPLNWATVGTRKWNLNQISNPAVRNITIKVTGLENLYRKDDKYVNKGNVMSVQSPIHSHLHRLLLDLSLSKIMLSSYPGKIPVAWLLYTSKRDTECERAGKSDSVQCIQLISIYTNPLIYIKSQSSHTTLLKADKKNSRLPCDQMHQLLSILMSYAH